MIWAARNIHTSDLHHRQCSHLSSVLSARSWRLSTIGNCVSQFPFSISVSILDSFPRFRLRTFQSGVFLNSGTPSPKLQITKINSIRKLQHLSQILTNVIYPRLWYIYWWSLSLLITSIVICIIYSPIGFYIWTSTFNLVFYLLLGSTTRFSSMSIYVAGHITPPSYLKPEDKLRSETRYLY